MSRYEHLVGSKKSSELTNRSMESRSGGSAGGDAIVRVLKKIDHLSNNYPKIFFKTQSLIAPCVTMERL
jgi:hypothetical protein